MTRTTKYLLAVVVIVCLIVAINHEDLIGVVLGCTALLALQAQVLYEKKPRR